MNKGSIKYKPIFLFTELSEELNAGGIQSRRFVDSLSKLGITPKIFSKKTKFGNTLLGKYDISFVFELPNRYFASIFRRIFPDLLYTPDIERFTYLPFLKRKLNKVKNLQEYDFIHTVSNPCSSHLAGLYLKKKTNLPWVAQFYDPWVGSCYRQFRTKVLKNFDKKLEEEIAKNADIIIHTNHIIMDIWLARYGEIVQNKMFVVPFCYDESVKPVNSINSKSNKKITVLYVGNLYLERNLDSLIKAIKILNSKIENLENKIVFKFIGVVSTHDIENIKNNCLVNFFELTGQIPHNQLVEHYADADVLLVIDAPLKENIFFPSKLIEYFLYKKPILGITPNISITHELLVQSGHVSIENNSIDEIVDYLSELIVSYDSKLLFNSEFYLNFSPELLANQYIGLISKHLFNNK